MSKEQLYQWQRIGLQEEFDAAVPYTESMVDLVKNFPEGFEVTMTQHHFSFRLARCGQILRSSAYQRSGWILGMLSDHTQQCKNADEIPSVT